MKEANFGAVVEQGIKLQERFPGKDLVAVGGTAAALHCGHRFSLDVDCVTPYLQAEYDAFSEVLEGWQGWRTNRKNPPVLILGERFGVELGLRQLRRKIPLRITLKGKLVVPTLAETIRIKAFLLGERRATRDYLDFAALVTTASEAAALEALALLNLLYPVTGSQTNVSRFAEATAATPVDLAAVDPKNYKGVVTPFDDWKFVSRVCTELGRQLLKQELSGSLPQDLPANFD